MAPIRINSYGCECSPIYEARSCEKCLGSLYFGQESLGVNHVTEPASSASLGIVFVLDHEVLRQICHHGMVDSDKTVSNLHEGIGFQMYLLVVCRLFGRRIAYVLVEFPNSQFILVLDKLFCLYCCSQVRAQAEDLLLHLIQSQLLMPATRWQHLLDVFLPVLPVLQVWLLHPFPIRLFEKEFRLQVV